MKSAKLTSINAIFFQNIKFCKASNKVISKIFCILNHILVGEFPPIWAAQPYLRGILKGTKSQVIHNALRMNHLANFILFY